VGGKGEAGENPALSRNCDPRCGWEVRNSTASVFSREASTAAFKLWCLLMIQGVDQNKGGLWAIYEKDLLSGKKVQSESLRQGHSVNNNKESAPSIRIQITGE
jgi:hypothetical protein